jgi:hypothetical protein
VSALRFSVDDPDLWQQRLEERSVRIIWPVQDARWGRFVLAADPDGRPDCARPNDPLTSARHACDALAFQARLERPPRAV